MTDDADVDSPLDSDGDHGQPPHQQRRFVARWLKPLTHVVTLATCAHGRMDASKPQPPLAQLGVATSATSSTDCEMEFSGGLDDSFDDNHDNGNDNDTDNVNGNVNVQNQDGMSDTLSRSPYATPATRMDVSPVPLPQWEPNGITVHSPVSGHGSATMELVCFVLFCFVVSCAVAFLKQTIQFHRTLSRNAVPNKITTTCHPVAHPAPCPAACLAARPAPRAR